MKNFFFNAHGPFSKIFLRFTFDFPDRRGEGGEADDRLQRHSDPAPLPSLPPPGQGGEGVPHQGRPTASARGDLTFYSISCKPSHKVDLFKTVTICQVGFLYSAYIASCQFLSVKK